MNNQLAKVSLFSPAVVGVVVPMLLTGCGGSGGDAGTGDGNITGSNLPFTCTNVVSSIAGCWASELCATDSDVPGIRLVEVVEQLGSTPTMSGAISSYLVVYDNAQCSGSPVSVTHLNALANFTQTYEEQGFDVCTDLYTGETISCVNLDITVQSNQAVTTGYTAYSIDNADNRLCLSFGDYNFDNTGNGGMGLPNVTDSAARPGNIDRSTGNCMTRVTF